MYRYRAFGFNIESEFEIAQMLPAEFPDDRCDVHIRYGEVSADMIKDPLQTYLDARFGIDEMWSNLDIAEIYVGHGRDIIVKLVPGREEEEKEAGTPA